MNRIALYRCTIVCLFIIHLSIFGLYQFEEIVNYYNWDFCQIQYNYMDTKDQPGDKGYELTVEKDIPLVIMEPIKGGALTGFASGNAKIPSSSS